MKKYSIFVFSALLALAITGCNKTSDIMPPSDMTPLEDLPDTYSLEQAKTDGCIVQENGDITQGKEVVETFWNNTKSGKNGTIRLASYYTLGDPSRYDPDYYESVKDDYPVLYIQDLSFDGKKYTLHSYEGGVENTKSYLYLMKYEEPAKAPTALYKSYITYVLTDDDTVTWQELMQGMFSSQSGDFIDHHIICTDLIYE